MRDYYEKANAKLDEAGKEMRDSPAGKHIVDALREIQQGLPVETAPLGKGE